MERDQESAATLERDGWTVLRYWEGDLLKSVEPAINEVLDVLNQRGHRRTRRSS